MAYVRNENLTLGHIKHLAFKCGYDLITPTPDHVWAVKTSEGEIVEGRDLPGARRFLKAERQEIQETRREAWRRLGIGVPTPLMQGKIREAIEACGCYTDDQISCVQGYLALEPPFEGVKGPVPERWIRQVMEQPQFYNHILSFGQNWKRAVDAELVHFGEDSDPGFTVLGHEVTGDICLEFQTDAPLELELQASLNREILPEIAMYNVPMLISFEHWQRSRGEKGQQA